MEANKSLNNIEINNIQFNKIINESTYTYIHPNNNNYINHSYIDSSYIDWGIFINDNKPKKIYSTKDFLAYIVADSSTNNNIISNIDDLLKLDNLELRTYYCSSELAYDIHDLTKELTDIFNGTKIIEKNYKIFDPQNK